MIDLSVFKDVVIMSSALTGAGLGIYNFVTARRKEYKERLQPRLKAAWRTCRPRIDSDVSMLKKWVENIRDALKEETQELSGGHLFWIRHEVPEERHLNALPIQYEHLRYHPQSFAAVQRIYQTIEICRMTTLEYRRLTLPVTKNASLRIVFPDEMSERRFELEEEMRVVLQEWGFDTDSDVYVRDLARLPAYRRKLTKLRETLLSYACLAEQRIAEYESYVDALELDGIISERAAR